MEEEQISMEVRMIKQNGGSKMNDAVQRGNERNAAMPKEEENRKKAMGMKQTK